MEGHGRSWKVKEGQGRSRKVKEGHGWYFPILRLTFQVKKVMGWFHSSSPFPLDFGFGIWDLDLGLAYCVSVK